MAGVERQDGPQTFLRLVHLTPHPRQLRQSQQHGEVVQPEGLAPGRRPVRIEVTREILPGIEHQRRPAECRVARGQRLLSRVLESVGVEPVGRSLLRRGRAEQQQFAFGADTAGGRVRAIQHAAQAVQGHPQALGPGVLVRVGPEKRDHTLSMQLVTGGAEQAGEQGGEPALLPDACGHRYFTPPDREASERADAQARGCGVRSLGARMGMRNRPCSGGRERDGHRRSGRRWKNRGVILLGRPVGPPFAQVAGPQAAVLPPVGVPVGPVSRRSPCAQLATRLAAAPVLPAVGDLRGHLVAILSHHRVPPCTEFPAGKYPVRDRGTARQDGHHVLRASRPM